MRRLTPGRDQGGAIGYMTALLIVPVLGMGALVLDIGAVVQERRELQNGADAAALAVAKDCAGGDCGSFNDLADEYADANADDADSNIDEVCGDGPGVGACSEPPELPDGVEGYVKVVDSTFETSSGTD
ncbi:MAG: pilus assembly protein TadG-related protein, partial [Acidimicrobiales bacterium]